MYLYFNVTNLGCPIAQAKNDSIDEDEEATSNQSNANKPKNSRSVETVVSLQDANISEKNDNTLSLVEEPSQGMLYQLTIL